MTESGKEIQKNKGKYTSAVGRRKEAIARVKLYKGKGQLIINGVDYKEYYPNPLLQQRVLKPFEALGIKDKFDIVVTVSGGGKVGQVGAIQHGIARAIVAQDEDLKITLRRNGLLTRDPRVKERKKYGLKRARKAPQFSKR